MWPSQWGCKVGGKRRWTAAAAAALGPAAARSIPAGGCERRPPAGQQGGAQLAAAGAQHSRRADPQVGPREVGARSQRAKQRHTLQVGAAAAATVWRDGGAWAGREAVVAAASQQRRSAPEAAHSAIPQLGADCKCGPDTRCTSGLRRNPPQLGAAQVGLGVPVLAQVLAAQVLERVAGGRTCQVSCNGGCGLWAGAIGSSDWQERSANAAVGSNVRHAAPCCHYWLCTALQPSPASFNTHRRRRRLPPRGPRAAAAWPRRRRSAVPRRPPPAGSAASRRIAPCSPPAACCCAAA